ncbi:hypothetical protein GOODEAATRI_017499 [Goodea atripinnis]|uniref:Uncharacterized protein n=1 Tax=Goodea atripinnis TaxID=208336 RepID=A0ABV0NBC7_9TELE
MWGHRYLNRLSSDGRAELDNVSPWAIIAVVVMWCVCVIAGGVWGTSAPGDCPWLGTSCQRSLSRLGVVSGLVVGAVLGGVCPVALVGKGWGWPIDVQRDGCVAPHSHYCIFFNGDTLYAQARSHSDPQVFRLRY